MALTTHTLLAELKAHTEKIIAETESQFATLSAEDLHQREDPKRWSIAECLEHLCRYGDYYLPAIEKAIDQAKKLKKNAKAEFHPGFLGEYFAKSMLPQSRVVSNKMRTFNDKNPLGETISPNIVDRFLTQQRQTLQLLEEAEKVDLGAVRIPVTISMFIRLKLGDVLRFVVHHNLRHLQQAHNVRAALLLEEL
jgi:DinB superfamily